MVVYTDVYAAFQKSVSFEISTFVMFGTCSIWTVQVLLRVFLRLNLFKCCVVRLFLLLLLLLFRGIFC